MNKLIVFAIVAMYGYTAFAQERTHKGFYLSMALGPAFGTIDAETSLGNLDISGTGIGFDMQIGAALRENLILHGTIGLKSIYGPAINDVEINDEYSIDEFIMGIGMTHYFSNNFFITGNVGAGNFSFSDDNTSISTDDGFSFQLKAGKEWWVSARWGLGVVLEYGTTSLTDTSGGEHDKWNSNRFSVRFIATLNGKK